MAEQTDTPAPEMTPDPLATLAHIVVSKTVMECAKLAGFNSVLESGWTLPRVQIVEASIAEATRTAEHDLKRMLDASRRAVAPMVNAMVDNESPNPYPKRECCDSRVNEYHQPECERSNAQSSLSPDTDKVEVSRAEVERLRDELYVEGDTYDSCVCREAVLTLNGWLSSTTGDTTNGNV